MRSKAQRRRDREAGIQALMRQTWATPQQPEEPEQEQVEPDPPARRFGAYARRKETT